MSKVTLELRPGEGGDDAKLFIKDLSDAYIKLFKRMDWKFT